MTLFEANKSNLIVRYTELFTSGSAKVYYAEFSFSADWNGFAKIATFRNGSVSKSVAVDETNIFGIPWEVFANPGTLECGITGTKEDGTTLPTIWATVAPIKQGAQIGDEAKEVTPDIYEQLISRLDKGVTQAQDAAERAEAAAINQPYPNQVTGTWWVWNPQAGEYVDSGISSAAYTLSPMTGTALGGAMADPAQEGDTQPVRIGADHKLYTAMVIEVSKADWNQNDETQPDYVKNRPFYTEMLGTSIEGMEINNIPTDGTLDQNIPLEIGQVWNVSYKMVNGSIESSYYTNLEVQQAEDGTLYLGDPDVNHYPFYITTTSVKSNSTWVSNAGVSSIILTCVSGTTHEEVVHQIPAKYIKDMYYTGDPVETVLVEENTVTFEDLGGIYGAQFSSTFEATVGDTYKVSWDGTVYESICVAVSEAPGSFIGNLSITGAGSDTGEPFVMNITNGEGILIASADTSDSHTFSISGTVAPVVKIDKKYLPSTIPFMEDGKIPEKYVQKRFPDVTDIFGGRLIGSTTQLSTLANPYPNKTILNALTVEAFNAMLNNRESIPRQVMIDNNLADVSPSGSTSISVEWSECRMYSEIDKPIAGAWVHAYKAKIHEDTDNPGTMVSECAVIRVTARKLT